MNRVILFFLVLYAVSCTEAPSEKPSGEMAVQWDYPARITKSHLRGLDVAADETIWASGTDGVVLRSTDVGKTWVAVPVPGAEKLDFRDIEAVDSESAIVLSAGNGLKIYRTVDAGSHWNLVFEDSDTNLFFDGMDFNGDLGIAFGDPSNGVLNVLSSEDLGASWNWVNDTLLPSTLENEAGYAASGTGICIGQSRFWIALGGGEISRVFRKDAEDGWQAVATPLVSGPGAGIFSMAFKDELNGIIVGGNYIDSTNTRGNAAFSTDGGLTWSKPQTSPGGYRSCVYWNAENVLAICSGRTGTDYSIDGGENWSSLSSDGFFSCTVLDSTVIGVSRYGIIGRLDLRTVDLVIYNVLVE